MNLLHIISSVDARQGGPVEAIKQLGPVLATWGHCSEVASLDVPDAPWLAEFPLKVYALGKNQNIYGYSPHFLPWLTRHVPRYDVVIVHGLWQYGSFGAWRDLRRLNRPYFVYTHGMLDPWFKRTYPLKHLKKMLYWPWAEYRVLRDARAVFFTCEEERVLARQSFRPYQCREIVVNFGTAAPVGDPEAQRQCFLTCFPHLQDKRLLLFLSRIHPKKGCDLLLEAFASVSQTDPKLHLVMAGPDQIGWQNQLLQLALRLGIAERITWTGMLSGDLKWGAFHAAEAFVLPSHQENFGIAVAEALAVGLPVLISNKVNIWREIQADGAGLVAGDTLEETQQLLQQWITLTEDEKAKMRRQTLRCFESRFEIQRAAESLLEALHNPGVKG